MPKPGGTPSLKWTGTKGDDQVFVASTSALTGTTYDGAAGYDTLNLSSLTSGVSIAVNLNNPGTSRVWGNSPFHGSWWNYIGSALVGPVVENTIKNFEKIVGTNFNDYIDFAGGSVARVVDGGAGDDAIYMGSSTGTNTLIGGAGSDQLFGSRTSSLLIGGTYNNGSAPGDDASDTFTMNSGTILDFELGVDKLYIDGATTTASWVSVNTIFGVGARLTMASDRVVTLIGVDPQALNAIPIGYVRGTFSGQVTSGPGDDFISANNSPSADLIIFPSGSAHDELVGFDLSNDSLLFSSDPTFSQIDYHGDAALLATYDNGASSVLLVGLSLSDVSQLHYGLFP